MAAVAGSTTKAPVVVAVNTSGPDYNTNNSAGSTAASGTTLAPVSTTKFDPYLAMSADGNFP